MELDPKFEALRRTWYSNQLILYQIIENLKYKETVFLRSGCVHRCIKANAIRFLEMNFDRYKFFKEPFNLYGSLAHYPDMPSFSFNRVEKRQEQDQFNLDYQDYMTKYDFLIDIDNPDLAHALVTLKKSMEHFKGVPYYTIFSGTKGFHIKVDYDDFPDEFKQMSFVDLCNLFKRFAENFSLVNNLTDIDYSIYDLRRIAKTPYSVVFPYYFVALPMSDDMIHNFELEEYSIKTCLSKVSEMRNRGVLKRQGTGEAFAKLIKKYGNLK